MTRNMKGFLLVVALMAPVALFGNHNSAPEAVPSPPAAGAVIPESYFDQVKMLADEPCANAVEKLATYDVKWTSYAFRFSRWNKYQTDDGVMTLSGDVAEMQNGFGNWVRMHYRCKFNPTTKQIVSVTADRGRLPSLD